MTDGIEGKLRVTERTRLRRVRQRGNFSRETIYSILDAMPMCHIGYVLDGSPIVMPTLQWREGDYVHWHASNGGRGIKAQAEQEVCLTVSLLDGFVLARSAFHHSVNYRSVMIFGKPALITDTQEKEGKFKGLVEQLFPGRWDLLRPMTRDEEKQTALLSLPIEEASAKIRDGGVADDEEDYALPIWAGVVPVNMQTHAPVSDPRNIDGVNIPEHAKRIKLG